MVVAGSDNAKSFPAVDERQSKVIVAGDQFAMYEAMAGQPQTWKWTWNFRLDPTKSPKQIEFTINDKQAAGIYQFEGDHWKVAVIVPGHSRPADFKPADNTLVLDMKRGEPAANAPASHTAKRDAN
jgi:uncharacterized protein (TIGR03067 family)